MKRFNYPTEGLEGREIFEILPIKLGGDPTDPKNKTTLTREKHIQAVRFWNRIIREEKRKQNKERSQEP
ncbi:MAG: hypothetical protein EHM23_33340 [Acidobacteria bacterium]|nr:MAG: hypothetical protein EHM23_33340 [Acidobacteriota bacterium]